MRYKQGGAEQRVARQRDESEVKLNGATESFMRAPSNADAVNAEGAGEFPGTPTYAPSSAEGCAPREAQARQRQGEAEREAQGVSEPERISGSLQETITGQRPR